MGARGNFWGSLIRQLREEQHVSQRQLSAAVSMNRATLRRIEEGMTSGEIDVMERLLAYLGYDIEAMERVSKEERLREAAERAIDPNRKSQIAAKSLLTISLVR